MTTRNLIMKVGKQMKLSPDFCRQVSLFVPIKISLAIALEATPELFQLYQSNADAHRLLNKVLTLQND